MSDIIEQAYRHGKLNHWSDLARWLRSNAADVNGTRYLVEAAQLALEDGHLFPDRPDGANAILRPYERTLRSQDRLVHKAKIVAPANAAGPGPGR